MISKPNILIVILFGCPGLTFSQSTDSTVKTIRAKYQVIRNNLETYQKVVVDLPGESTEGGELNGYYKNKDLKLIKTVHYGETGKAENEYYFDNDRLIFCFEKRYTYNRPIFWDKERMKEYNDTESFDPKKTIVSENRYYFNKEKLVRWLDNKKKQVDVLVEKNRLVGEDIITNADKLRKKLEAGDQ